MANSEYQQLQQILAYRDVTQALATGAQPAMLCAMCPWDRPCVMPPTTSTADVSKAIDEALAKDETNMEAARLAGQAEPVPAHTLLAAIAYGGKDTAIQVCPVLSLRLRTSAGRGISDGVRRMMQDWDDER